MSANIKLLLMTMMLTVSTSVTPALARSGGIGTINEQALLVFSIGLGLPILFIVFMNCSSVTFTKLPKDEGFDKYLKRNGYKNSITPPKPSVSSSKLPASNSRLDLKAQKTSGARWKAQK